MVKEPGCQGEYWPSAGRLARCCYSHACQIKWAEKQIERKRLKRQREESRRKREKKEKMMTISQRYIRARKAAQKYARLRDMKWFETRGERPKCILCGTTNPTSWHGCHFVPVGSKGGPKSLHPANINLGCGQCNFFANQSTTDYEPNMRVKYGDELVDYLMHNPFDYQMKPEEIDEVWRHYLALIKNIKP